MSDGPDLQSAVTVLAFFFVPISLASSIFGMNLQEINQTGHTIVAFIVTAVAMLAVSGFAWLAWRAGRNFVLIRRHASRSKGFLAGYAYLSRWRKMKLMHQTVAELMSESRRPLRWLAEVGYWSGLRSVEKGRNRERDVLE